VAKVAMTLSSYFIGICRQLLYGPLLDRFEGKAFVYWVVSLYFSLFGLRLVTDIDTFIGLRFIQAVGSCATR
jgi:DHA1 family bicyclomycin/chloramphenicol resistance-like MFS transporter